MVKKALYGAAEEPWRARRILDALWPKRAAISYAEPHAIILSILA